MSDVIRRMWSEEEGQDIAEYAVMLAVILVLVWEPYASSEQTQTTCFLKWLALSSRWQKKVAHGGKCRASLGLVIHSKE